MPEHSATSTRASRRPRLCVGIPGPESGLIGSYRDIPGYVARLEQAGAAQVGLPDRLLMTEDMTHPGGGAYRHPPTTPYLEPMVTLGAVAVGTERIRLTTTILLAPLRQPVVLAKAAATVDVLSGGRLDLGLGAGWFEPEFEAAGAKVDERFARLEEAIEICRLLWGEPPASFRGRWSSFDGVTARPAPVQGTIPIWIGTQARPSARTARRIATWADGWSFSSRSTFDDVVEGSELLVAACAETGRDPQAIALRAQVQVPPAAEPGNLEEEIEVAAEAARPYGAAGVDYLSVGHGSATDVDEVAHFVAGVCERLARFFPDDQ